MFNCSSNVTEECLKRRIFAAKQASWPVVEKVEDGATVFLCDEDSEVRVNGVRALPAWRLLEGLQSSGK